MPLFAQSTYFFDYSEFIMSISLNFWQFANILRAKCETPLRLRGLHYAWGGGTLEEALCSRPLSTGFNSDGAHFQRSISDAELAKRFIQLEKCCFIVNCFSSRKIVKMEGS